MNWLTKAIFLNSFLYYQYRWCLNRKKVLVERNSDEDSDDEDDFIPVKKSSTTPSAKQKKSKAEFVSVADSYCRCVVDPGSYHCHRCGLKTLCLLNINIDA